MGIEDKIDEKFLEFYNFNRGKIIPRPEYITAFVNLTMESYFSDEQRDAHEKLMTTYFYDAISNYFCDKELDNYAQKK